MVFNSLFLFRIALTIFVVFGILSIWAVSQVGTFESWLLLITALAGIGYFYQKQSSSKCTKITQVADFFASVFPILFIVFFLRSFIFEPFRIPSGSMIPTLHVGDFVLVNKFSYGVRLPILGWRVLGDGDVKRGDIVVFRFPENPSIDYIKRIVAKPGDKVALDGRQLIINGRPLELENKGEYLGSQKNHVGAPAVEFYEKATDKTYSIVWFRSKFFNTISGNFIVPEGKYFVMGDNRNNSNDSRFWGFVDDNHLKGKAVLVWLNWGDTFDVQRIGTRL